MSAIGFNRVILPAIRPRETSAICICADHQRGPSRPTVRFLLSKRKLRLSAAGAPQQLVFRFRVANRELSFPERPFINIHLTRADAFGIFGH
jgi:hypothetical protein